MIVGRKSITEILDQTVEYKKDKLLPRKSRAYKENLKWICNRSTKDLRNGKKEKYYLRIPRTEAPDKNKVWQATGGKKNYDEITIDMNDVLKDAKFYTSLPPKFVEAMHESKIVIPHSLQTAFNANGEPLTFRDILDDRRFKEKNYSTLGFLKVEDCREILDSLVTESLPLVHRTDIEPFFEPDSDEVIKDAQARKGYKFSLYSYPGIDCRNTRLYDFAPNETSPTPQRIKEVEEAKTRLVKKTRRLTNQMLAAVRSDKKDVLCHTPVGLGVFSGGNDNIKELILKGCEEAFKDLAIVKKRGEPPKVFICGHPAIAEAASKSGAFEEVITTKADLYKASYKLSKAGYSVGATNGANIAWPIGGVDPGGEPYRNGMGWMHCTQTTYLATDESTALTSNFAFSLPHNMLATSKGRYVVYSDPAKDIAIARAPAMQVGPPQLPSPPPSTATVPKAQPPVTNQNIAKNSPPTSVLPSLRPEQSSTTDVNLGSQSPSNEYQKTQPVPQLVKVQPAGLDDNTVEEWLNGSHSGQLYSNDEEPAEITDPDELNALYDNIPETAQPESSRDPDLRSEWQFGNMDKRQFAAMKDKYASPSPLKKAQTTPAVPFDAKRIKLDPEVKGRSIGFTAADGKFTTLLRLGKEEKSTIKKLLEIKSIIRALSDHLQMNTDQVVQLFEVSAQVKGFTNKIDEVQKLAHLDAANLEKYKKFSREFQKSADENAMLSPRDGKTGLRSYRVLSLFNNDKNLLKDFLTQDTSDLAVAPSGARTM